jgi:hypothetical protein
MRRAGTILLVASAAFLAWFVVFGGPVFGPYFDEYANKQNLRDFINHCPRDKMRLRFYSTEYKEYMEVRVNLTTRALIIGGSGLRYETRGYFWVPEVHSVFHTLSFPLMSPLPPAVLSVEQMEVLRSALADLPPAAESSSGLDWNHNESYLAFYWQDDLQIDRFVPGHAPPQFAHLCRAIGFGPFFENWNSGHMP